MKTVRKFLWWITHILSLVVLLCLLGLRLYSRAEPSLREVELVLLLIGFTHFFSEYKIRQIEKWTKGVGE